jgi:antitoxin component YwqK of YwqJK toxin-antitoxin module
MRLSFLSLAAGLAVAVPAHAIIVCELDGQHVNPANGHTTAGKSGLMRCRDGEGGPLQREQELRDGKFVGLVRFYKDGVLHKEHRVNERGNRDGPAREYAATAGAENRVLREETLRDGTTVGLARSFHPNGTLRRASFHADDGREQAVAEFTADGRLAELRCGPAPQLAPAADDAAWCGHRGTAATVDLFGSGGVLRGRITHERGERRRVESFHDGGKPSEIVEIRADGGRERSFSADGTPRREREWTGSGNTRTTVLEREFHESGTPARERRWTPDKRGARLASEATWYQNGQPRERHEYRYDAEQPVFVATSFHDNGKPSGEGSFRVAGRYERLPLGIHKRYDEAGRLRVELHQDERGRIAREREYDDAGRVKRDDEVFPDGSRKAYAR